MSIRTATLVVLLAAASAAPALAAPFCTDDRPGMSFSFTGRGYTESEINDLDLTRLRQMGVDATRVERWNGCIRAFVRNGSGEEMQFFDPNNFRRVE